MNESFRTALISRLTELTADLRFDHRPTGTKIAPQIVDTMLPPRGAEYEKNEEFPFVRVALLAGKFQSKRPMPFSIHLVGGIWTQGSIADGVNDITALTLALGGIVGNRSFSPCRLTDGVDFIIGNPEKGYEGLQPHPMYYLTMNLDFLMS